MTEPDVREFLRAVPVRRMMADLTTVAGFDRYQASDGITGSAAFVAEQAEAAGLSQVRLDEHRADGAVQWGTFAAPRAWTPRRAVLTVTEGGRTVLRLDHGDEPYLVATYSAATPGTTEAPLAEVTDWPPDPRRDLTGAVAVISADLYREGDLVARLTTAGAAGFVTDGPWRDEDGTARRGRIELPPGSSLRAFSLTPAELDRVRVAARRGGRARLEVVVDEDATMPVVSAVLPGTGPGPEIWVMAHLCHPRPGANDNASGVAAALATARVLRAVGRAGAGAPERTVRFWWGPEFVATAAILAGRDPATLPAAVLNLDMVGEDQARCRSPFVLERPPDHLPSVLTPLAEDVLARVFSATAAAGGTWHAEQFHGFSDHALFADPAVARPAVQFCHPADRFNHSAADSVDKVSADEMRRSAAAAAALAWLCARPVASLPTARAVTERWCRAEVSAAAGVAGRGPDGWGDGLLDHVRRTNAAILGPLDGGELWGATGGAVAPPEPEGPALRATWTGPLNLRAMQAALSPATRADLAGRIMRDKMQLALLFNFAIRADGRRSAGEIVRDTSYGLRRPITGSEAGPLLAALRESGWVTGTGGAE